MSGSYELNPKRFGKMPIERGVVMGLWYLICKSECSDDYHLNDYGMGSKLWCLGVNYRVKDQGRLLQKTVEYILECRRCYRRWTDPDYELTERENELAVEYYTKDMHMQYVGALQRTKPKLP